MIDNTLVPGFTGENVIVATVRLLPLGDAVD